MPVKFPNKLYAVIEEYDEADPESGYVAYYETLNEIDNDDDVVVYKLAESGTVSVKRRFIKDKK